MDQVQTFLSSNSFSNLHVIAFNFVFTHLLLYYSAMYCKDSVDFMKKYVQLEILGVVVLSLRQCSLACKGLIILNTNGS